MNSRDDYLWDPATAPDEEIAEMERALSRFRHVSSPGFLAKADRRRPVMRWAVGLAAAAVILIGVGLAWQQVTAPTPWSVETVRGRPLVTGASAERLAAGGVVRTDGESVARVAVGRLGLVDLAPGSKVELLRDDAGEHRLALRYGTLHARIWAPPRFFVVETPRTTVVDLGCVYSVRVDSAGNGILAVSEGEVEIGSDAKTARVSAGIAVRFMANGDVGLPFPIKSSSAFRSAVDALERGAPVSDSLMEVIAGGPMPAATTTLWHLLARTRDTAERSAIVSAIARAVELPPEMSRQLLIEGDSVAQRQLGKFLEPRWSDEPNGWWHRLLVRVGLGKPAVALDARRIVE